ncbi:MAG: hypothetical protein R6U43_01135 [Candidatus Krumholzibacteriales bacterium]
MTGAGILPGPDIAGIALAFLSVLAIPAILINLALNIRITSDLRGICRLISTGFIYISLLVCTGLIPGIDLGLISILGASFNIILILILAMKGRPAGEKRMDRFISRMLGRDSAGKSGLRIALFIVLFALLFTVYYGNGAVSPSMDSLDHLSFIRRAAETEKILPEDSFYIDGDGEFPDPRKGIFHSAEALILLQSEAKPLFFWKVMPAFIAFAAVAAFLFFAFQLLDSRWKTALAVILLFVFFRGEGAKWFIKIAYSRNIAQILFWLDLGFVLWSLKNPDGGRNYTLLFFLALAGAAVHPVFALTVLTALLALLIHSFLPGGSETRRGVLKMVAVNAAGMAVPLVVRLISLGGEYNFIHTHMQGMLIISEHLRLIDPLELRSSQGVILIFAVVSLPLYFLAAGLRRSIKTVESMFIIPVILVINPITGAVLERYLGYIHSRMLNAAPVICFTALIIPELMRILFTGRPVMNYRPVSMSMNITKRIAAAAIIIFFIAYPLKYEGLSNMRGVTGSCSEREYAGLFEEMNRHIPGRSVILSDPVTSYFISGMTGHFVYLVPAQHEPPSDLKAPLRNRRARDLFCTPLSEGDDISWIGEEGIEYLLLDNNGKNISDFYGISDCVNMKGLKKDLLEAEVFGPVADIGDYSLMRFKGTGGTILPERKDTGEDERIPEEAAALDVDAGGGIKLRGLYIRVPGLKKGSLMEGTLYWERSEEVEFGLPLMCTVRLDTSYPKGSFYRGWYSKLYRRELQERTGTRYRHTFSGFVRGEYAYPDRWTAGDIVPQDFSVYLPANMKSGDYQMRVKVWKKSYLRNRKLKDYFLDNDSRQGVTVLRLNID